MAGIASQGTRAAGRGDHRRALDRGGPGPRPL